MTDHGTTGQPANGPSLDRQIRALTEIVGLLAAEVMASGPTTRDRDGQDEVEPGGPAQWVWTSPVVPAEATDPEALAETFVTFYNQTYVGMEGTKARPIPLCWRQHPGLAMEVATLAHSWFAANTGPTANVRDAQSWHHQWRPGFDDRLTRDWVHADCFDGQHRSTDTY